MFRYKVSLSHDDGRVSLQGVDDADFPPLSVFSLSIPLADLTLLETRKEPVPVGTPRVQQIEETQQVLPDFLKTCTC